MRIATQTVTRNYLKRLENNFSNKYNSEKKVASYRQFDEASEMPAQAASAMRVRKAIANLNTYQENLKTADSIYASAESSVIAISEIIQTTYEKCIEAANGTSLDVHTHAPDQMEMIASGIDAYADEIHRLMNLVVADRRIFGGVNNDEKAFAIKDGRVFYNGVDVDSFNDPNLFPESQVSYCDIGLGMTLDKNGRVDEQSALPVTFNGMDVIGCGKQNKSIYLDFDQIVDGQAYSFDLQIGEKKYSINFTGADNAADNRTNINNEIKNALGSDSVSFMEHGLLVNNLNSDNYALTDTSTGDKLSIEEKGNAYSNNIIQSILDAAKMIREGNGAEIAKYADHIYSLQTKVSLTLAKIGNQTKFIEFNQTRITNNLQNLTDRQNDLESTDLPSEITNRDMLDSIYTATLQMGATIIPQSIFDFI